MWWPAEAMLLHISKAHLSEMSKSFPFHYNRDGQRQVSGPEHKKEI